MIQLISTPAQSLALNLHNQALLALPASHAQNHFISAPTFTNNSFQTKGDDAQSIIVFVFNNTEITKIIRSRHDNRPTESGFLQTSLCSFINIFLQLHKDDESKRERKQKAVTMHRPQ